MQSYWSVRVMKRRLRRAPAARRTELQRQRPADLPSSARENAPPRRQAATNGQLCCGPASQRAGWEGAGRRPVERVYSLKRCMDGSRVEGTVA